MKTWEMIKELTENPEKKFESVNYYGERVECYNSLKHAEKGYMFENVLVMKHTGKDPEMLFINDFFKKSEWMEVRQAVSFMEIVKAAKEGKMVGLKYDSFRLEYAKWELADLLCDISNYFETTDLAETILEGKWYIED